MIPESAAAAAEAIVDTGEEEKEEVRLLNGMEMPEKEVKPRGGCMRIICLIFCCETSNIGSASHLNKLNEQEIQMVQQNLVREMERRERERRERDKANTEGGLNDNGLPDPLKS